jgi:ankyrin repeat protein
LFNALFRVDLFLRFEFNYVRLVRDGDTNDVRNLLNKGADINAKGVSSNSALHIAFQFGRVALVNLLLRYNCGVNVLDDANNSPLHIAAMNGRRMKIVSGIRL